MTARSFVLVNGAKIEKTYFDDSVAEALRHDWRVGTIPDAEHRHCDICGTTLTRGDAGLESEAGWVCSYCFRNFIKGELPRTP